MKRDWRQTLSSFTTLFFIAAAYYLVKPVRASLVVSELGASALPYLWILSTVCILLLVGVYSSLAHRFPKRDLLPSAALVFAMTLISVRVMGNAHSGAMAIFLFIWTDLLAAILIERFWAKVNTLHNFDSARRLYGIIASGGILGGLSATAFAAEVTRQFPSVDLLYIAAGFLLTVVPLQRRRHQPLIKLIHENRSTPVLDDFFSGFKMVARQKYLAMILVFVALSQIVSNIIDYQFYAEVGRLYPDVTQQAQFFSWFYFWINLGSLVVLMFTVSPIHRTVGLLGALLILPFANFSLSAAYLIAGSPVSLLVLKWVDETLNYSLQRVSKEMLYLPASFEAKFKAKAVIDCFGVRASRVVAALLVIPVGTTMGFLPLTIVNLSLLGAIGGLVFRLVGRANRSFQNEVEVAT